MTFKSFLALTSCLAVGLCAPADYNSETDNVWTTPFVCEDGLTTINRAEVCDGMIHCNDSSDEDPELCKTWECDPATQFKCRPTSTCIPSARVCDNRVDCEDASDEDPHLCQTSNGSDVERVNGSDWSSYSRFHCEDGVGSVRLSQVCDKTADCADDSDENPKLCETWFCSPEVPFRCGNSSLCLPETIVCDRRPDCPDGNDEDPLLCDHNVELELIKEDKSLEEMLERRQQELHKTLTEPLPDEKERETQEYTTAPGPDDADATAGQPTTTSDSDLGWASRILNGVKTLLISIIDCMISFLSDLLNTLTANAPSSLRRTVDHES